MEWVQDQEIYLVAVSSPLLGDSGECGVADIVLEQPGLPVLSTSIDDDGKVTTETLSTTEQFITVFPYSDDQYLINVTGTGINPLLSEVAESGSAAFNVDTGELTLPRVKVSDDVFQATLTLSQQFQQVNDQQQAGTNDSVMKFVLSEIGALSVEEVVDAYRATFNPSTQQVIIPRVTVEDAAYSVIMQYHAAVDGKDAWFEVVNIEEIK